MAAYESALEVTPLDFDTWANMAAALGSLGEYTRETAAYQKAVEARRREAEAVVAVTAEARRREAEAAAAAAAAAAEAAAAREVEIEVEIAGQLELLNQVG